MAEGNAAIEVPNTTSVRGERRRVYLTRGQPGRVVVTVYVGRKPIDVVVPIRRLAEAIERLESGL